MTGCHRRPVYDELYVKLFAEDYVKMIEPVMEKKNEETLDEETRLTEIMKLFNGLQMEKGVHNCEFSWESLVNCMDTEVERKHVAAFNTMLDNVSLMQFYSKISDPYTEEQMKDIERLLCEMEDTYEQFQEYLSKGE